MRSAFLAAFVFAALLLFVNGFGAVSRLAASETACRNPQPAPEALRLPATLPPGEPTALEQRMLVYLQTYHYRDLGWCVDKYVRDTGPYVHGAYYGTHPAVRIYYSGEMTAWLRGGRHGVPPDGAVMIKEQYPAPAARYDGLRPEELQPKDWTIMIRRSSASRDGWFWAEVYTPGMTFGGTQYPNAGFGLYCLRCHASADHAGTFSSLENIRGFPGEPIVYRIDDSWRLPAPSATPDSEHEKNLTLAEHPAPSPVPLAVQTFPAEPLDTMVENPHGSREFVTSDQCIGCHSAATIAQTFGPTMWTGGADGRNVSEYGEWRWSPMALAGRDPVFYAQLESELEYLGSLPPNRHPAQLQQLVVDTCTQCHNAMGKRTFAADHPTQAYSQRFVFDADPARESFHYGGLARDGISCTVCHRSVATKTPPGHAPLAYFLDNKINGRFDVGPSDRLYGPFEDKLIVTHQMNEALGSKPRFSAYVKDARLCGSCHTINLPVLDHPLPPPADFGHDVEQNTYVEWINSRFQTEYKPLPGAKSCQDCHMPDAGIGTRIALVQDGTYPQSSNMANPGDVNARYRKTGFRRHELLGLNAFLLEVFKQNPGVMGVRLSDYMTGTSSDIEAAIANVVTQAQTTTNGTATVSVAAHVESGKLIADVTVSNLTGHRFPSGVGFRRAFLDVEAADASASPARTFFASGRTNERGLILGSSGEPLPSESFARGADGREAYQPHFDRADPITSPDQAQIFEELTRDANGDFTTSFIRRDRVVKDNRLLPAGWRANGPPGVALPAHFLEATLPQGRAARDPAFVDGAGHAIVRYEIPLPPGVDPAHVRVDATLNYQSWAPYFIAQRTSQPDAASHRLRALLGSLQLDNTPLAGWKLKIAEASATL
jgi:mono/diheme cytochrome c family protein